MSTFPGLNEKSDKQQWGKEMLDAAINHHRQKTEEKKKITANFNNYNGKNITVLKKQLIKRYGGHPSTNVISYRLGKTKIDLLRGEFVDIDIKQHVESANPDVISEKAKLFRQKKAAMKLKPELQELEKGGLKLDSLGSIPSEDDPELESKLHPKTKNEIVMQAIIDDKIKRLNLKLRFLECMMNLVLTSEAHLKIYKNRNGEDDIMPIDPRNAIYQEATYDPLCEKTPYSGDVEWLYPEDILIRHPDLGEDDVRRVKELDGEQDEDLQRSYKLIDGKKAFPVYYLQWWTASDDYTKISPSKNGGEPHYNSLTEKEYRRNKKIHKKNIEKGKYSIDKKFVEEIYHGIRISEEIYHNIEKMPDQINCLNSTNKYSAHTDYVHILYNTVNGERVSLEEVINSLSDLYDQVMFAIASEVRKLKGKVTVYDEALKPHKRTTKKILYDIYEHGILNVNSAQEGFSDDMSGKALDFIKELDLGLSNSFPHMLSLKADIERTLDKVTGINEARGGEIKPTMTATGAMQNLEASRSTTRDIYFYMDIFTSTALTKLAEKTKLNTEFLKAKGNVLYGEKVTKWIKVVSDKLSSDTFIISVSDGKEEADLRKRMEQYFPLEVNSGNLRSMDIYRFNREKNFNRAIQVLEEGYQSMQGIRREEMANQSEQAQQTQQAQIEMMREDREDKQSHEMDKIAAEGAEKLKQIETKANTEIQNKVN